VIRIYTSDACARHLSDETCDINWRLRNEFYGHTGQNGVTFVTFGISNLLHVPANRIVQSKP